MSEVKETLNAVGEIAKAVPIYQDLAQPAMREIGKAGLVHEKKQ